MHMIKSIAEPPPKPAIVLGSEPWRTCVRYSHCLDPRVIAIIASVEVIIIIIIITRPKPAYGRQGLAGGSLRASSAQLGSGK